MRLADILITDGMQAQMAVRGKKDLLEALAGVIAPHASSSQGRIFDILVEREKLGSTGMGGGVAIPHGKLEDLENIIGVLAVLKTPIEFGATDDEKVDLVIALIAPVDAGGDHLNALSLVSRFFRDKNICKTLRAAQDNDALVKIVADFDAR